MGRAHPRVCGADATRTRSSMMCWGSSPRVRGRLLRHDDEIWAAGFIPACAGQTEKSKDSAETTTAHPRVCGADFGRFVGVVQTEGLIPACAGQTCRAPRLPACPGAHPRVCGADNWVTCRSRPRTGSSPRVRGRQLGDLQVKTQDGLIPACAGQTSPKSSMLLMLAAHPRVCGADNCSIVVRPRVGGSSPRVRGRPST